MRRVTQSGRTYVECVRSPACGGTRGLPIEFVEDRSGWQQEYGGLLSRLGEIHQKFALVNEFQPLQQSNLERILDVGCAYGHYLLVLQLLNPRIECYGLDLSKHACETVKQEGLVRDAFWQGTGDPIPLEDNSLDWAYSFDTIEHVPLDESVSALFGEVCRILKPGGRFFLFFPNFNQQTKCCLLLLGGSESAIGGDHCNMLTAGDVIRLASPFFSIEHIRFVNPVLNFRRWLPLLHGLFSPRLRIAYNTFLVLQKKT
ncbi:MAG: methyltransferase domain-containing protein [bacterium]